VIRSSWIAHDSVWVRGNALERAKQQPRGECSRWLLFRNHLFKGRPFLSLDFHQIWSKYNDRMGRFAEQRFWHQGAHDLVLIARSMVGDVQRGGNASTVIRSAVTTQKHPTKGRSASAARGIESPRDRPGCC
jgi:hypothetical protein